jgi:hypothetical protein
MYKKKILMKIIFRQVLTAVLMCNLLIISVQAQSTGKFSYQAIIRNNQGALVSQIPVTIRVTIVQGTFDGKDVYSEIQNPTTNINGLISIEVGGVAGFNAIKWADGPFFIKTETDLAGGSNFTLAGISQILYVPYALHAETAEKLAKPLKEADPLFTASVAAGISKADTARWNQKPAELVEKQGLSDVIAINNKARGQIKNLSDPIHPQDAVTKAYMEAYLKQALEQLGITPKP